MVKLEWNGQTFRNVAIRSLETQIEGQIIEHDSKPVYHGDFLEIMDEFLSAAKPVVLILLSVVFIFLLGAGWALAHFGR